LTGVRPPPLSNPSGSGGVAANHAGKAPKGGPPTIPFPASQISD